MCLKKISLPQERMTDFDLKAFVRAAEELNRRNADTFTVPFPKDPSRFVSRIPRQTVSEGMPPVCPDRPFACRFFHGRSPFFYYDEKKAHFVL